MANIFSASEIAEVGIQIEKNGRDFYEVLARQSKSKKAQDIFGYLKEQEQEHVVVFQKILDTVNKYEPKEAFPQEYFAYMNALASNYVFTQKDKGRQIAKSVKSDKEAISLGLGFEKDSVVFYEGMKKAVPADQHDTLDKLIMQEKDHIRQLHELEGGI